MDFAGFRKMSALNSLLSITSGVGAVTHSISANVTPIGQSASFSIGRTIVFGQIDTSQTPNYATISTSQTPSFSEVDTSQTPSYEEIEAGRDAA